MIPLKGLPLALEALSRIEPTLPIRLRVVGEGPLRAEMEKLAQSLMCERPGGVSGLGALETDDGSLPPGRHFLFTSLRDSSGAVLTEALAYHLPILTLNHQGVGAIVPSEAGIKVEVTSPEETVSALADGLRRRGCFTRVANTDGQSRLDSCPKHELATASRANNQMV